MGCDIHMYAEKKIRGEWQKFGPCFPCAYYRAGEPCLDYLLGDGEQWLSNEILTDQPYKSRNYTLFAWLADVRNGLGVAGVDTGDRIPPLSEPRGIPEDASLAVKKKSDEWGSDGHSHSWFLLSEIFAADISFSQTKRGIVGPSGYAEFRETGAPSSWCGGISGMNVRHVSNEEMEKLVSEGANDGGRVFTKVEWQQPISGELEAFMNAMKFLAKFGGTDELRIVFWFDN